MAWGFFKKIKDAFKKAGKWVKDKIINPVVSIAKPILKTGLDVVSKAGTAIGGAIGTAKGNPELGLKIGGAAQGLAGQINPMIK